MDYMPTDILGNIYLFVSMNVKKNLTKKNYIEYLKNNDTIPQHKFDTIIRKIIRKNYYFLLDLQFEKRFLRWIKLKKWRYKGFIYDNYIEYIRQLCNENNSYKCLEIIKKYAGDMSKKKYKRRRIRNIRWTN